MIYKAAIEDVSSILIDSRTHSHTKVDAYTSNSHTKVDAYASKVENQEQNGRKNLWQT